MILSMDGVQDDTGEEELGAGLIKGELGVNLRQIW